VLRTILKRARHDDEQGFTLIELMVVVLIIAILIAIAIPTFLGARQRANDRAAQSNLRNALTAEKTYYSDKQQYTASNTELQKIEPSQTYQATAGAQAKSNQVYVAVSGTGNTTVALATQSANGDCYWLKDVAGTGTTYGCTTGACTTTEPGTYSSSW
jgi:type IV pilus assembly protein PilA